MADAVPHILPLAEVSINGAVWDAHFEVHRQDDLAREGKFGGTHTLPDGPDSARLAVLVEEVGEVARVFNEAAIHDAPPVEYRVPLRSELVQVAAVAVAWIAAIDEGRP